MNSASEIMELESADDVAQALNLGAVAAAELASVVDLGGELLQQDAARAAAVLGAGRTEAAARGELDLAGECAYLHARASLVSGMLEQALQDIDDAVGLWNEAGEPLKAARTGLGRMNILDDLGRHEEAIAVGEKLVATIDALFDNDGPPPEAVWMRAAALENVGVGHGYLGHHEQALEAYRGAEETYRANQMTDDVPRPLANSGVELLEMGRLGEAITALRSAAIEFEKLGDRLFQAKCMAYEAKAQWLAGNFVGSAAATAAADDLLADQETSIDYARSQLVRAETLASLNLVADACGLAESLIERFAADGLEHDLAAAHLIRADALFRQGLAHGAAESFREAEKRFESVGDLPMAAVARLGTSQLLDNDSARAVAAAAVAELSRSHRHGDYAAGLIRMSQLEDGHAIRWLDAAAGVLADHKLPHLKWKEQAERGRRLRANGELEAARVACENAMAHIDDIRRSVDHDLQRMVFMGGRDEVHRQLVAVLLEMDEAHSALEVTERARARTLVERLHGEVAGTQLIARDSELDELYSQLLTSSTGETASIRAAARQLEGLDGRLLAPGGPAPASAPLVGHTVVTYQILGDEVIAFVEKETEVSVVRGLTNTSWIKSTMQRLDAQWRRFADPGLATRQHSHLMASTIDILQQLHLALIGPLHVLGSRSLVVVPIGELANIPFAALHDGTCHLLERMPVVLAPSRRAAEHANAASRPGTRRLLIGVADELTPHVESEIAAIKRLAPAGLVLEDDAATVEGMWRHAGDADIIHIASHAIERPDNPLFGAVKFADRWLTAAEIAGSQLNGQLVILSSCSSGRQFGPASGDELMGLARSFLTAGAGSVLVNLWQVDDEDAANLMTEFHRGLNENGPVSALRLAQLAAIEKNKHPYRWAAGVVIGAPDKTEVGL